MKKICNQCHFEVLIVKDPVTTIDSLIEVVCSYFAITVETIKSTNRKRSYRDAMKVAMYLIRKNHPQTTFKQIGKIFSGRDHSTVMYSIDQFEALVESDKKFKNDYNAILLMIAGRQFIAA